MYIKTIVVLISRYVMNIFAYRTICILFCNNKMKWLLNEQRKVKIVIKIDFGKHRNTEEDQIMDWIVERFWEISENSCQSPMLCAE